MLNSMSRKVLFDLLDMLNRIARRHVTLAEFFASLDESYRHRFRQLRREVRQR
jgi:hypothetical protein